MDKNHSPEDLELAENLGEEGPACLAAITAFREAAEIKERDRVLKFFEDLAKQWEDLRDMAEKLKRPDYKSLPYSMAIRNIIKLVNGTFEYGDNGGSSDQS